MTMDIVGEETLKIMEKANWYNHWLFSLMAPYLTGDILEIGSGIGNFTDKLMKKGTVWASDINPDYLNKLRKKYKNTITVSYGDIEKGKFDFNNQKFDAIVCLNVLEHIKEDFRALKNMYKLLKPRGKLLLLVPAHMLLYSNFDKSLGHFRRYTTAGLYKNLARVGFKNLQVRYLNWFGAIGWYVFLTLSKSSRIPDSKLGIFDKISRFLLLPEKVIRLPFGLSVFAISQK